MKLDLVVAGVAEHTFEDDEVGGSATALSPGPLTDPFRHRAARTFAKGSRRGVSTHFN